MITGKTSYNEPIRMKSENIYRGFFSLTKLDSVSMGNSISYISVFILSLIHLLMFIAVWVHSMRQRKSNIIIAICM